MNKYEYLESDVSEYHSRGHNEKNNNNTRISFYFYCTLDVYFFVIFFIIYWIANFCFHFTEYYSNNQCVQYY